METVDQALAAARSRGLARLDGQLLVAHVLRRPRAWLLAHGDDAIAPSQADAIESLCRRRARGEPLAYLVGEREFHGLALAVDASVLVPRPETETLVDWALSVLEDELRDRPAPAVVDLGTGSGAIALAIGAACPRASVWAVERSAAALATARSNSARLALDVHFVQGDWWQALPAIAPAFDLAVGNPPYVAAGDPHLDALAYEPREALVAADDGLADIRTLVAGARGRLAGGARLLVEHGWTQGERVQQAFRQAGFTDVQTRADLAGRPRCTGGRMLAPGS
jgi:release factor glutamine methyltransferase